MAIVIAYTDGSADNIKKTGGYGLVLSTKVNGKSILKKHKSNKYCDTTNNRMEMKGILKALQMCKVGHTIDIHSDSKYCIDCINLWLFVWINNGTVKTKKNGELWAKIWNEIQRHKDGGTNLHFIWIRGHAGNSMNELADKLAKEARFQVKTGISCKTNN